MILTNTHWMATETSRRSRYFAAMEPSTADSSVVCELQNCRLLAVP